MPSALPMAPSRVGRSALRRSVNVVWGANTLRSAAARMTRDQDLCNMIQYVLTYYPNVGASKRETANGGTQPARGGRAGAAAGRPGRGRNLARGS